MTTISPGAVDFGWVALDTRLVRPVAPSRATDLGVGVVGYGPFGGMGYLHGLAAAETDGLALVAAADSAPGRLDAARSDFPALVAHESADSLGDDPNVDIAIIAPPPVLHAQLALQLLRAGKHVALANKAIVERVIQPLIVGRDPLDREVARVGGVMPEACLRHDVR